MRERRSWLSGDDDSEARCQRVFDQSFDEAVCFTHHLSVSLGGSRDFFLPMKFGVSLCSVHHASTEALSYLCLGGAVCEGCGGNTRADL